MEKRGSNKRKKKKNIEMYWPKLLIFMSSVMPHSIILFCTLAFGYMFLDVVFLLI